MNSSFLYMAHCARRSSPTNLSPLNDVSQLRMQSDKPCCLSRIQESLSRIRSIDIILGILSRPLKQPGDLFEDVPDERRYIIGDK